jgi:hypothetical protein
VLPWRGYTRVVYNGYCSIAMTGRCGVILRSGRDVGGPAEVDLDAGICPVVGDVGWTLDDCHGYLKCLKHLL